MARDRIYTSQQFRDAMDNLRDADVLGLSLVENKDAFMLATAIGLSDPIPMQKKVGLFLNTALKTVDKALIASVLMGTVSNESQIDEFADLDRSSDLCEQCAERGYQLLLKKYNDAGCDKEVFERMLIKELELLYTQNIESDF